MPTETLTSSDLFAFDWFAYLNSEDYQDWVDLEVARLAYERDPAGYLSQCKRMGIKDE